MCSKLKEILLSIFLISVSPSNNGTPYARFIGEHRANSAMSLQGHNLCRLHFLWPLICTFVLQDSCSWSCTLWKSSALVFPCCSFEVVLFSLRKFHVVLLRQLLKKQTIVWVLTPKDVMFIVRSFCSLVCPSPCLPRSGGVENLGSYYVLTDKADWKIGRISCGTHTGNPQIRKY